MSYASEHSPRPFSDEEERSKPTIKLTLKLNVSNDKKHKKKYKKKKKHKKPDQDDERMHVGGKRPFAALQSESPVESDDLGSFDESEFKQEMSTSPLVPPAKLERRSSSLKSTISLNERPKKRGRPTIKAKAAAAIQTSVETDTSKRDLITCLLKLLDNIQKKDVYGFFLEPVNPTFVPDYLNIIQSPMDFSTMRTKIKKSKYHSIADFRKDFDLVISNAKLYNARDTVYWKSADKMQEVCSRMIDRVEKQLEEEEQGDQDALNIKEEEVDIMGLDTNVPLPDPTRETSVESTPRTHKKKKKKAADTGVLYGPDGSLHTVGGVPDLETLLPLEHPFCDPPQMTVTNPAALPSAFFLNRHTADEFHHLKHFFHSAHFCDYGPYPTLGAQPPGAFYTAMDATYIYPIYGDDRGEAYLRSLWDFIDEEDDILKEYCEKKSNELTKGTWAMMRQVLEGKLVK